MVNIPIVDLRLVIKRDDVFCHYSLANPAFQQVYLKSNYLVQKLKISAILNSNPWYDLGLLQHVIPNELVRVWLKRYFLGHYHD